MSDGWTVALAGATAAMLGLGLAAGLVAAWSRRVEAERGGPRSLVAPVLAVDALEPPLRLLYLRTLRLVEGTGDGATGRELRRLLMIGQAAQLAGRLESEEVIGAIEGLIAEAEGGVEAGGSGIRERARAQRARWERAIDGGQEAAERSAGGQPAQK